MNAYVDGTKVPLDPSAIIGQGGEAEVYDIGGGRALKLWKQPDHPDYQGSPVERDAAAARLDLHQRKLRAFPGALPARVVAPIALATDRARRRVVGYVMQLVPAAAPLLRYGDRAFRDGRVSAGDVVTILLDLHRTLHALHAAGVVVGDFHDLNVLVAGTAAHVIDADSFQFGAFPCRTFTERFVNPVLCDPSAPAPVLCRPHNQASDWYAFAAMLMQSLLCVGPHGGVHRPRAPHKPLSPSARILARVTIFHPEVRYPRPAFHHGILPDNLLHRFHSIFEKDERGPFPRALIEGLRFGRCPSCGTEHARRLCPSCSPAAPAAPSSVRASVAVRGAVTATRVFRTEGSILFAAVEGGRLVWLSHDGEALRREDGAVVLTGPLDALTHLGRAGDATLVARLGEVVTLRPGRPPERLSVDHLGGAPAIGSDGTRRFWAQAGRLLRDGELGPEHVGDVLAGQTRLFVGPRSGFGFYRAGGVQVAFVFAVARRGLHDGVPLPPLRGELVDAACLFAGGGERCWFIAALVDGGVRRHRCSVVRADGAVEATAEATAGDGSWLGGPIGGACAAEGFLLVPTDEGIVRVEPHGGALAVTRAFPDTAELVDSSTRLFATMAGLHVVARQEIRLLEMR